MTPVDVVSIAQQQVGVGKPVFIIAEIGINHNGDLALAKQLIDVASQAGCDAVKFQKRTPVICVPPDQASTMRETPWGTMTYLEYKERIEFGQAEFSEIDAYCRSLNIMWFASPWDVPSVAFLQGFDTPVLKVASACLTDDELLVAIRNTGKPVIMSTGMSTLEEIDHAVSLLDRNKLILGQATSTYPCKPEEPTCEQSLHFKSALVCQLATLAMKLGCRPQWQRLLSVPCSSNGTSHWTAPCGAPTTPPASNPEVSNDSFEIFVTSKSLWVMARNMSLNPRSQFEKNSDEFSDLV